MRSLSLITEQHLTNVWDKVSNYSILHHDEDNGKLYLCTANFSIACFDAQTLKVSALLCHKKLVEYNLKTSHYSIPTPYYIHALPRLTLPLPSPTYSLIGPLTSLNSPPPKPPPSNTPPSSALTTSLMKNPSALSPNQAISSSSLLPIRI